MDEIRTMLADFLRDCPTLPFSCRIASDFVREYEIGERRRIDDAVDAMFCFVRDQCLSKHNIVYDDYVLSPAQMDQLRWNWVVYRIRHSKFAENVLINLARHCMERLRFKW